MPNYLVDATLCLSQAGRYRGFIEGRIAESLSRSSLNHSERWRAKDRDYIRWTVLVQAPSIRELIVGWADTFRSTWPEKAASPLVQVAIRNIAYDVRQTLPPYHAA